MNTSTETFVRPAVSPSMYWPEITLLVLSWVVPLLAWLIWHNGLVFQRSGSLMVFFAAVAEFVTLNRANTKHLLNAKRVLKGQEPWAFSKSATAVGIAALISALAGTILWGFGDFVPGT